MTARPHRPDHFGEHTLFDRIVAAPRGSPDTLFAYDGTRLALDGDELLGIEE